MDFKNERLMMPEEEVRNRIKELLNESQEDLIIKYMFLEQQCKKQKEVIDKASNTLERGITFCENDSQGVYDVCNMAINREKEVLNILKEASE